MMDHRDAHDKLWMLQDPELAEEQRRAILAHLDGCGECAKQARRWRLAQRVLARAAQPEASEAFVARVMERLPEPTPASAPARIRWTLPWRVAPQLGLGLAGLLAALLFVRQQPAMTTEALLLAGEPQGNGWEFSAQAPDAEWLLNSLQEAR